jgi:serine O-acetyltransferase
MIDFDALGFHRVASTLGRFGLDRSAKIVSRVARILFSAHIPPEAQIGEGTHLGYGGLGIVIHKEAVIGRNVLLSPGVVIGGRSEMPGAPIIEDNVLIGVGAKILGPVRIGEGAKVGANAVVIDDVLPGDTVVGIPARPVVKRAKAASYPDSEELAPPAAQPAVRGAA